MQKKNTLLTILLSSLIIITQSVIAAPGDTLHAINAARPNPQGLTFDGEYLWQADRRTDEIYQIDPTGGTILKTLPAPGYTPCGLTWDGNLLWCVDAGDGLIHAIDPETGQVRRTIYCPVSKPGDLAWDGDHLWIADYGDDMIHQISSEDGTTLKSIKAPSSRPGGLAFDGKYLWVSDRYKNMIYMMHPETGDVIIVFDSPGPYCCGLAWDSSNLWSVDYQNDRIYKHSGDDGTLFTRSEKKSQHIDFIHQVRNFGPDSVLNLDVYLAIPEVMNNQEILGEVTFTPQPLDILSDKWDQKVAHFEFKNLDAGEFTEVVMHVDAELYRNRYFIFPDKVGSLGEIPKNIKEKYLSDNTKFSMQDDIIQTAVVKAVGEETSPYWIGRKIYNYVIDQIEYERVGGWNIAPTVLDRGTGSCSEYSFVYIAMCRAAGLPARYVGSLVIRGDDASWDNVFHRWVEIYLPNYGWIPVDPSGGDSEWPAERADSFGYLNNRFLITTAGGGGSEYLDWSYNGNEKWISKGRCKIEAENFGEWTPLDNSDDDNSDLIIDYNKACQPRK
jgi:sugar lactone lactonase YvrE